MAIAAVFEVPGMNADHFDRKLGAFAGVLMPIIAGVGVTPPQPRIAPVHYMSPQ